MSDKTEHSKTEHKKTEHKTTEHKLELDKRIVERMLQRGAVSRADYEAHLQALPDLTTHVDNIADQVYDES